MILNYLEFLVTCICADYLAEKEERKIIFEKLERSERILDTKERERKKRATPRKKIKSLLE